MYFNKVFLLCCIVATPLAMQACQPRGNFGRTEARKLTKKDLHVGPERSQQRKQEVWEIVQAKKAHQLAQMVQATRAAAKDLPQSLPVVDLPFMDECQETHSSHYRLDKNRLPVALTMGFILLCMIRPTLAAVAVQREHVRGVHYPDYPCGFSENGSHVDDCHSMINECLKFQNFINTNRPAMDKEVALAKQYSLAIGAVGFPAYPTWACPSHDLYVDRLRNMDHHMHPGSQRYETIAETERNIDRLVAFINEFNRQSEVLHTQLTPYLEAKQQQEKAETERRIAETERKNAELARQNAEIMRQNAELAKQYAEIIRIKAEEQNKDAIRQALAVIKSVSEYMNEHMKGKSYQLKPCYQEAFDFFSKNPEHCISAPDEECKRELAAIQKIEVISRSASDEEFIRELTGTDSKEQTTGL